MTAAGISISTLAFPDPDFHSVSSSDFLTVDPGISYSYREEHQIVALSITDTLPGSDINAILYTPTLRPASLCPETSKYIPAGADTNVIPKSNIGYVALAPWINANCTEAYFSAVQSDPIRAFVFYQLDNGTTVPNGNEPVWDLGDGGAWRGANKFPVYAIPNLSGQQVIQQIAAYSGNISNVPNGPQLASLYPNTDFIRLAIYIDLVGGPSLPTLWVFLLMVLGILIFIIGATSISMHLIQRRRRNNLRDRVANGEIDLEALGIKRLTVPENVLKKMPIYTYTVSAPGVVLPSDPPTNGRFSDEKKMATTKTQRISAATTMSENSVTLSERRSWLQPTCAICLEDFVPNQSTVRELPCLHIFHPECIDPFFRENSSLCPMCKKSVLPRGYCPAHVTNAMVRRERIVRRLRDRVPREHYEAEESRMTRFNEAILGRIPGIGRRRRDSQLPTTVVPAPTRRASTRAPSVELSSRNPSSEQTQAVAPDPENLPNVADSSITPAPPMTASNGAVQKESSDSSITGEPVTTTGQTSSRPPRGRTTGSLWARHRAVAMVDESNTTAEVDAEEEQRDRRPAWRKAIDKIFPRA